MTTSDFIIVFLTALLANLIFQAYMAGKNKRRSEEMRKAANLHIQTIIELQRIRKLVNVIRNPKDMIISEALSDLEKQFQQIHDRWNE